MIRPTAVWMGLAAAGIVAMPAPAVAQSAREVLTQASFADRDKAVALRRVGQAQQIAAGVLRRSPDDWEASLMRATAIGYMAKLNGNRGDAIAARKLFEGLVARDPGDPDAQVALGAWHVGAVFKLGKLVGRAALGAQKAVGFDAIDRAVKLGGNRAMFLGLGALLRLELDPSDLRGRAMAEAASRGSTPTPIDRIMQRAAAAVLVPLRAGNEKETRALAARLLPFGHFGD